MFIAVSAEDRDLSGRVSPNFEQCKYLLIVNMDSMQIKAISNPGDPPGNHLAQEVVDHDCEAIITGELSSDAFEILAGACVTRYYAFGHTAKDAISLMNRYKLKLIRDVEGNGDCSVNHSESACQSHHHD